MNCCLHHKQVAVVFSCKGCGRAMCWECSQQGVGTQNEVCSDCAGSVSRQPKSRKERDSIFSIFHRACAIVYLAIFLAIAGGGICTLGAQWAINVKTDEVAVEKYGGPVEFRFHSPFNLFFYTGITDWKAQFAMGATVGAGAALIYSWRNHRKLKLKT